MWKTQWFGGCLRACHQIIIVFHLFSLTASSQAPSLCDKRDSSDNCSAFTREIGGRKFREGCLEKWQRQRQHRQWRQARTGVGKKVGPPFLWPHNKASN